MLDDTTISTVLGGITPVFERLDPTTWRAVVPSQGRSYRLFVHVGERYLRVELAPFLSLPEEPVRRTWLLRELLRRNRTLTEGRFSLDDDDEVLIEAVCLPSAEALGASLDSLIAAAEAHFSSLS
jgi:hypothetical protein